MGAHPLAGLGGVALWGLVLAGLKTVSQRWAFSCVFLGAALFRWISFFYMVRMVDLPSQPAPPQRLPYRTAFRKLRQSNFARFILYIFSVTFATQVASPYFNIYMLRDLNFSYASYMAVNLAAATMSMISFPVWGRHADVVGNAEILKETGWVLPLLPILWLFAKSPASLIVVETFSGFIWGGFNLCTTNFVYDAVPAASRARGLGYFNLLNGIAIFLGASLGGYLAERLPLWGGSPLLGLFLLSGALRGMAFLLLSGRFSEVRASTRKVSSRQLFFSVVGIRPFIGPNAEWGILALARRFSLRRPVSSEAPRAVWPDSRRTRSA